MGRVGELDLYDNCNHERLLDFVETLEENGYSVRLRAGEGRMKISECDDG